MTAFSYKAVRADGERVAGVLDVASIGDASAALLAQGLYPVVIVRAVPQAHTLPVRHRAALADGLLGIGTALEAGLPLERALAAAADGSPVGKLFAFVKDQVAQGASLSQALTQSDRVPPIMVALIRAGEVRGQVAHGALAAAEHVQQEVALHVDVRNALAYPLIVCVVGVASLGAILAVVVPRFAAILGEHVASLPAASRGLLALSALLHDRSPFVAAIGILAIALAMAALRAPVLRTKLDTWRLHAPLVGPLTLTLGSARIAGTLGPLLDAGVHPLTALDLAAAASGNGELSRRVAAGGSRVSQGQAIGSALVANGALSARASQLALFGDECGRLGPLLSRAGALDGADARRRLAVLVRVVEPVLIVTFGAAVALVAAALLQAVYSIRPGL